MTDWSKVSDIVPPPMSPFSGVSKNGVKKTKQLPALKSGNAGSRIL
jgi:hypothetical protein